MLERFSPTADFSTDKIQIMPGDSIHFNDISKGGPTSWEWQFEGGNPSSSTQKNPIVKYPQEGSYDVVLKVKNQFGENIITRKIILLLENLLCLIKKISKFSHCIQTLHFRKIKLLFKLK
ncbi:MAG: PKD domain-containing protein [Saprospiraceae bacterium]|nr:PKD domain-containing protein [Saprospiraceae bacterium]